MVHLGWSVPMADPSYYVPGAGIHSFLMFAPFFALYEKKGMVVQGLFLFLSGPILATFFSSNLMEQASIWCFFSIAQVYGVVDMMIYHCTYCMCCTHISFALAIVIVSLMPFPSISPFLLGTSLSLSLSFWI